MRSLGLVIAGETETDRGQAATDAGLLKGECLVRSDVVRVGDLGCAVQGVPGDYDDVRIFLMQLAAHQGRAGGFELGDTDVADDFDIGVAEAALVGFLDELVLVGVEAHHVGGDTVGLNGLVGGDDHVDVNGVDRSRGAAFAADDAVDDGAVRFEEVQHVGELLVDVVGVVPLTQEVRNGTHGVLEAQGDAGVDVGLHLRDGDIEGVAGDDLVEEVRNEDLFHDLGLRQHVTGNGATLQRNELAAVMFGDAVIAGDDERSRSRERFTRGLCDDDVVVSVAEPVDDSFEDTGVRGLRIVFFSEAGLVVNVDEVRLDDDFLVAFHFFGQAGACIEVVEGCEDGLTDRFDIFSVEVLIRTVVLRQRDVVVHVVHDRCILQDDIAFSHCRSPFLTNASRSP